MEGKREKNLGDCSPFVFSNWLLLPLDRKMVFETWNQTSKEVKFQPAQRNWGMGTVFMII